MTDTLTHTEIHALWKHKDLLPDMQIGMCGFFGLDMQLMITSLDFTQAEYLAGDWRKVFNVEGRWLDGVAPGVANRVAAAARKAVIVDELRVTQKCGAIAGRFCSGETLTENCLECMEFVTACDECHAAGSNESLGWHDGPNGTTLCCNCMEQKGRDA